MTSENFSINNRNEKVLGELFSFFILETILIGYSLNINPYDQPSVELIKKETKKSFKVIITGGFSELFKDSIKTKVKQDFDITINGLIRASKLIK